MFKQGWACLFGALMLALLLATHLFYPQGAALARYDFPTLAALAIQVAMLALRLETFEEAKVILAFHVVAGDVAVQDLPERGSIPTVAAQDRRRAAFSGFMYAAVAVTSRW